MEKRRSIKKKEAGELEIVPKSVTLLDFNVYKGYEQFQAVPLAF